MLLGLLVLCTGALASGEQCTVADCKSFQAALLKRVFELDWSGSAGADAFEAEAEFQSRAIVPIDWVPVFDALFDQIESLLRRCVEHFRFTCFKADVFRLKEWEQQIEAIPGERTVLESWISNRSDISVGNRFNVARRVLVQTLRRERAHFAALGSVCLNANCSAFFEQRVSQLDMRVFRAVQGVKPFTWSQPESSKFLIRFTTRPCVGDSRPFFMCWPELATRWLSEMRFLTTDSYVLQMAAMTPVNTSVSNDFFDNLKMDVLAPDRDCFWGVCCSSWLPRGVLAPLSNTLAGGGNRRSRRHTAALYAVGIFEVLACAMRRRCLSTVCGTEASGGLEGRISHAVVIVCSHTARWRRFGHIKCGACQLA